MEPDVDWWQQNQGYFIIALFPILIVIAILGRRWRRRYQDRLMQNMAKGVTWGNSGSPVVDKIVTVLSTVVHFSAGPDQVAALIGGTKLPFSWEQTGPHEWSMPIGKGSPVMGTIARLQADGAGSRLSLVRAPEIFNMPVNDASWRKLRKLVVAAAEAAGIDTREEVGDLLVRTPQTDHTGLAPIEAANALHYWEPRRA